MIAEIREIARQERENRKLLDGLIGDHPADRAEDDLINFLTQVRHERMVVCLREIERMAVYGSTVKPIGDEIQMLWHVRYLYELIAEIGIAHAFMRDEVEHGKRSRKRSQQTAVLENQLVRHFTDVGYADLTEALRLAEKRALFYQDIDMLDHQHEALLLFREFIDRVERLRVVNCHEPNEAKRPRKVKA